MSLRRWLSRLLFAVRHEPIDWERSILMIGKRRVYSQEQVDAIIQTKLHQTSAINESASVPDNFQRLIFDLRAKGDEESATRVEALRALQMDAFARYRAFRDQLETVHAVRILAPS